MDDCVKSATTPFGKKDKNDDDDDDDAFGGISSSKNNLITRGGGSREESFFRLPAKRQARDVMPRQKSAPKRSGIDLEKLLLNKDDENTNNPGEEVEKEEE